MDFRKSFRKWGAYRQTVRELNSLDDRALQDLGITRGDIQSIARQHAQSL